MPEAEGAVDKARFMASVPIGYAEIDAAGKLATANAQFLGLSSSIGLGGNFAAALDEASRQRFSDLLAALARQPGDVHDMDCTFAGPEPRSAHLSLSKGKGDGPVAVFAIDKTESRLMEAQLAQSQKMQAICRFAADQDAAHGPELPRCDGHQAECQSRGGSCAPSAGLLTQTDNAAQGA